MGSPSAGLPFRRLRRLLRLACTIPGMLKAALCMFTLTYAVSSQATEPTIDNERVLIWNTKSALPPSKYDFVEVPFSPKSTAVFGHKGDTPNGNGAHCAVIELKDFAVAPIANETGLPLAFPRPHARKLLENERIIIWDYAWRPGKPTPTHFHDKDAIAVYQGGGSIRSTTLDGKSEVRALNRGDVLFNRRDRSHSELYVSGSPHAVIVELK
jgi:hypothetical protein